MKIFLRVIYSLIWTSLISEMKYGENSGVYNLIENF